MRETAEGLFIPNYDSTIIIHNVLAITDINQLCKWLEILKGRAGWNDAEDRNLNFNIISLRCFVKRTSKLVL